MSRPRPAARRPAGPRFSRDLVGLPKLPAARGRHRVFAGDLRGFVDSGHEPGGVRSTTSAEDLHLLVGQLGAGPVHLTGRTSRRSSASRPCIRNVVSLTAIEMGLPGFA